MTSVIKLDICQANTLADSGYLGTITENILTSILLTIIQFSLRKKFCLKEWVYDY